MPKNRELSLQQRVEIQLLHTQGKSQVQISKTVKCSRRAVQYALDRFKNTGSHSNRPRTGRKRITTQREDRKLIRTSLKNRRKTSSELAADVSEGRTRPISARTTRRRLLEAGLKGCKARKKPWLSDKNKKSRYDWALKYQSFTEDDWSNIVWSDESNFEVFGTPGVSYVRRRVGEEYSPECVVLTVKHGGGSIMIWGCMAASGVGEMCICEGRMDSLQYINVLETALAPSFSKIFGDTNMEGVRFQQDNAPCHKSARTMNWFQENSVDVLEWPAQSQDLNSIEHLWSILKRKVRNHSISSKEDLKQYIQEEWNNINKEECRKLVRSMPKRIADVIKTKGSPTKY